MPRAVNAHAYVNATFSMTVDSSKDFVVLDVSSLVFGGIGTHTVSYVMQRSAKLKICWGHFENIAVISPQ